MMTNGHETRHLTQLVETPCYGSSRRWEKKHVLMNHSRLVVKISSNIANTKFRYSLVVARRLVFCCIPWACHWRRLDWNDTNGKQHSLPSMDVEDRVRGLAWRYNDDKWSWDQNLTQLVETPATAESSLRKEPRSDISPCRLSALVFFVLRYIWPELSLK